MNDSAAAGSTQTRSTLRTRVQAKANAVRTARAKTAHTTTATKASTLDNTAHAKTAHAKTARRSKTPRKTKPRKRPRKAAAVATVLTTGVLLAGSIASPATPASPMTLALPSPAAQPATPTEAAPSATPLSPVTQVITAPAIPAGAIQVGVGDSLQAAVDQAPAGSTFAIATGIHRGDDVTPKAADTFLGLPGAVLDGSIVVTGWQKSGSTWSAGGVTVNATQHGECAAATPDCAYAQDVFVDGVLQRRATSAADLTPGSFFIDYAAQRLWLGSDPSGHLVELGELSAAISGTAPSVTIAGLTVQRYAAPAQSGAIDGSQATGWTVTGVIADQNHGVGIVVGDHGTLRNCQANNNGEDGLGATGADVVIDGCEVAGNNTAGYSDQWSAGGAKFAGTENLLVSHCFVHDNAGPGLWTDESNEDTTYSSNLVQDNAGDGIFEEISYGVHVTGNTVLRNGRADTNWIFGAGIQIASSSNAEVDHNYLDGNRNSIIGSQQDRGSGKDGPHLLQGLWVHDNVVVGGGQVGVAEDNGSTDVYVSRNNRFDSNSYPAGQDFGWDNSGGLTFQEWQSYGLDVHGS